MLLISDRNFSPRTPAAHRSKISSLLHNRAKINTNGSIKSHYFLIMKWKKNEKTMNAYRNVTSPKNFIRGIFVEMLGNFRVYGVFLGAQLKDFSV